MRTSSKATCILVFSDTCDTCSDVYTGGTDVPDAELDLGELDLDADLDENDEKTKILLDEFTVDLPFD